MSRRSALLVLASCCVAARAIAQPDVPDGFAVEAVVLDPFDSPPIGFAWLPDGRTLVIEKDTGRVRLAVPGSTASGVILTIPDVTTQVERGLLGVAVDPNWPARPYVYFHATRTGSVIHITMYTASGDLTDTASTNLTLGDPYVLLNDIPDLATTHNGGTLRFGPDGLLYVSLGEDVRPCEAQNLAQPHGKILRLDVSAMPGSGLGPPPKADITPAGNPFTGGDWQGLTYTYGLRNPFRFTVDSQMGNLYIGDVGHLTWEEVDELVQGQDAGANYGWPEYEGPLQDPVGGATDCSTPPFVPPAYVYPNPPGAGVAAIVCGPRYRAGPHAPYVFPRAYDGTLFVADFYGGWIRRLARGGVGWSITDSVAGQPSVLQWAGNLGQIVDLQQGPDGALYFMSFINGGVVRGLHRIVNTLPSDAGEGAEFRRVRSVPNPARRGAGVRLEFDLEGASTVRARIFDPAGRLVCTLGPASESGALHWNGLHRDGRRAGAGLYVFEIEAVGWRARGKIVMEP